MMPAPSSKIDSKLQSLDLKKKIILLKRYTVITLFWISGSRERIEMFREGNSFSPRVRHSES